MRGDCCHAQVPKSEQAASHYAGISPTAENPANFAEQGGFRAGPGSHDSRVLGLFSTSSPVRLAGVYKPKSGALVLNSEQDQYSPTGPRDRVD